jgi:hypothetical protein
MEITNHDFPYHDYKSFDDGDEPVLYQVGKSNQLGRGDQHKLFTSKSTLLIATATTTVRFNSTENVTITLIADVPYTFYSNIHTLYVVTIGTDGVLYAYFEGVHPKEARRPE